MAFEPRPNTGSLFKNDFKKTESHPDMKGEIYADRGLLENVLHNSDGPMVKISISAWSKNYGKEGKKMLSLVISEPYEKPQSSNPWE